MTIRYRTTAALILWLLGLAGPAQAACDSTAVIQALQQRDLPRVEQIYRQMNRQTDCSRDTIDPVALSLSQLLAARAQPLIAQGRFDQARALLDRAPRSPWQVLALRGDLAARQKQWAPAAQQYNQAYQVAQDPNQTPRPPGPAVQEKLFARAAEAQVLAGTLDSSTQRGRAGGILSRGVVTRPVPLPVGFAYDSTRFTPDGRRSAVQLADYLRTQNFPVITLMGHTDPSGDARYNQRLSQRRAAALADFLHQNGVRSRIRVIGKGEACPLQPSDHTLYSDAELCALYRRVELVAHDGDSPWPCPTAHPRVFYCSRY